MECSQMNHNSVVSKLWTCQTFAITCLCEPLQKPNKIEENVALRGNT